MGLLDMDMSRPEAQGFNNALLGMAQALLTPRARGGGMGAAFAAFPAAIDRAKQQAMREQLMALQQKQVGLEGDKLGFQMEQARAQQEAARAKQAQFAQLVAGLPADQQGVALALGPKYFESMVPQAPKLETIFDDQGREQKAWVRGPGSVPTPVGGAKQTPMPWEYEIGPDGQPRMRPGVLSAKTQVASAGKPTVDVKVETKMGESLGAQIGPMLKASRDKTEGAMKLGAAGQQIIQAIDSGKVIAGPGASWVMRGAQIAEMLGVGGKDNSERILNTRHVIRGLAESAVEARKELAGQGQVTENEAKAVEKAMSGNIDELTVDEIKLIAGLNVKAARLRASQHQQMVSNIPESMRSAAPFYAIPGMDQWLRAPEPSTPVAPAASTATPGKVRMRFDPKVGGLVPVK